MQYDKVNVIDSRLEQDTPLVKMYRGPGEVSRNVSKVVGGVTNNQQLQFNLPLTASNYFDRSPIVKTVFTQAVVITNTTGADVAQANAPIVPGVDVTMSAYPFMTNCVGIAEVVANGIPVCSYDMSKHAKMLLKLTEVEQNMKSSTCPSCPENSFAIVGDAQYTMSNSQASYNDATGSYQPNGSWAFSNITGNAVAGVFANGASRTAIIELTTYEPLILPPFNYGANSSDDSAIFGLNSLLITLNVNQLTAFRCLRTLPNAINGCALACTSAGAFAISDCQLLYKTFRAPSLKGFKLPSPYSIFHTVNFYSNFVQGTVAFSTINTNTTGLNMQNCVSTGMPSLIILWSDKGDSNYVSNQCKYFNPITNLSIDLGTHQNMLSNYDTVELYNISVDAGLSQSFLSYIGNAYSIAFNQAGVVVPSTTVNSAKQLVGGPIVLRPGISFPLPAEVATNSNGSFTFNFNATTQCRNQGDVTAGLRPYLHVLMIYDTWVTIDTATLEVNVKKNMLTVPEVLGLSEKVENVLESDVQNESGGALQYKKSAAVKSTYSAPGQMRASRIRKP